MGTHRNVSSGAGPIGVRRPTGPKRTTAASTRRPIRERSLRLESLEQRTLLSIGRTWHEKLPSSSPLVEYVSTEDLALEINADFHSTTQKVNGVGEGVIEDAIPRSLLVASGKSPVEPLGGSVTSLGDSILKAADLRSTLGVTGQGVKVGVISLGIDHWSTVAAAPYYDLPSSITINSSISTGTGDEGTALMEILHDLAPDAQLFFSGSTGSADMPNAIDWLVGQGVDVIMDDIGNFAQPFFEDGSIAQAAQSAIDAGVTYVASAGNYGPSTYNSGWSHYQHEFVDDGSGLHDFGAGDISKAMYVDAGAEIGAYLQWSDPWNASGNDYDLYLLDASANVLASSENYQTGTQHPYESLSWTNGGAGQVVHIVISKFSGQDRELELFAGGSDVESLQYNTRGDSIIGHSALTSVITVGAISASDTNWDDVEDYSSRGPSTVYTDFPSQTSVQRNSLDVCGITGVQTRVGLLGYHSNPFYGTSAATPHIAAIAALLLELDPTLTPAEVQDRINNYADDIETAGYDHVSGYGRANALASGTMQEPDDVYEENDSKAIVDARPPGGVNSPNLGPIEAFVAIDNLAVTTDDEDWYRFETLWPSDSGHLAGILFSHSQGDLDLQLLASDGTTILDTGTSADDDEAVSLNGLGPGTYYLRVYGYNGATNPNYDLRIWPGSEDDPYEDNDSLDVVDARPIAEPYSPNLGPVHGTLTIQNLILGTDWEDYYQFVTSATSGSTHRVAIEFTHANGDLDMELLDEFGGLIDYSESTTDNEEISLDGLPAGTYYVSVYGWQGAQNDYSLTIETPLGGDDPYENNNSKAIVDARPEGGTNSPNLGVISDVVVIDNLAMVADSEDWFRFETPAAGRRGDYVGIRFSHDDGDLDLELLDANGNTVAESYSTTDDERVSLHGLPAGVYYARIHGWLGATNPAYSLRLQTQSPDHRLLSAPFTTDEEYTLEYELLGAPGSSVEQLQMGDNELIVTSPSTGADPFELIFDIIRVGSMADQTSYQYDALGNVSRKIDALGRDIEYEYDGLGRLTLANGPEMGDLSEYEYDENDNLIVMWDPTGRTDYFYDEQDRLDFIWLPDGISIVDYEYDPAGRIASITYPDATEVVYGYDEAGRLASVTEGSDVTSYTYYSPSGLLHTVTLPNQITGTYSYDDYGRLTDLVYTDAAGWLVTSFHYTLDNNGNRTAMEVRRQDASTPGINDYVSGDYGYSYDPLNRLIEASYPDGTVVAYTYDANGNRVSTSTDPDGAGAQPAVVENYHYGQDNRLESITDGGGTTVKEFFYDPRGNVVMIVTPTGTIHYEYDYRNLLVEVDTGTDRIQYEYDGNGDRVARIANGQRTTYVNDPNRQFTQVLLELDDSGAVQAQYTYGLGRIAGLLPGESDPVYYIADALGSAADLTDATGAVLQSYSYDAFGALRPADPAGGIAILGNGFLFSGENVDPITGLVYLRARYYDPATGRFLSKDPSSFVDGPNLYLYVGNNPPNAIDPSGESYWDRARDTVLNFGFGECFGASRDATQKPWLVYSDLDPIQQAAYRHDYALAASGNRFWEVWKPSVLSAHINLISDLSPSRLAYSYGTYYASRVGRGGVLLNRAVDFVGDLENITGATVDPVTGQVVLLGTQDAGGAVPDLRLDDFVTAVRAVFGSAEDPGVTIDPQEGHESDPSYPQIVHLFAGLEDTEMGWVLFEADRVMKTLAAEEDNVTGQPVSSSV